MILVAFTGLIFLTLASIFFANASFGTIQQSVDDLVSRLAAVDPSLGRDQIQAITNDIAAARFQGFAFGGFCLVVGIGLALWIGRRIARPLADLSEATMQLAQGDLDAPVPSNSVNELARMSRALEAFRENAREVERLRADEVALKRAKDEELRKRLDDVSTATTAVLKQAESRMASIREGFQSMAGTLVDVAGDLGQSVDETSASAGAVGQRATDIVTAIDGFRESNEALVAEVGATIEAISRALSDAEGIGAKMSRLTDACAEIERTVELIQSIAAKTNMLALNATIEAARAGEAGKGFAVVAGEVKALAAATAQATDDITGQVSLIQSSVEDVSGSVSSVVDAVQGLSEASTSVRGAVEQQVETTEVIQSKAVTSATEIDRLAGNFGEVAEASQQVRSFAGEIDSRAESSLAVVDEIRSEIAGVVAGQLDSVIGRLRAEDIEPQETQRLSA
ncbi:MAG: methyl-accepting chemotaxis protein [Thalassobaculaceae bacterium]